MVSEELRELYRRFDEADKKYHDYLDRHIVAAFGGTMKKLVPLDDRAVETLRNYKEDLKKRRKKLQQFLGEAPYRR